MTTRVARLSILDSYGVRWSHDTFARDLLQNFFDSTADFRDIGLSITEGTAETPGVVEIRGPETFDIELLAYIGATTKTSGRTVGGFGEGFKICALVGARDFGLTITAGSGANEIAVFFDAVPLGRELCYRVTTREEPLAGSYVRLEGCDAACIAAFRAAPQMFRHPEHPRLQAPIVVDEAEGVGVYAVDGGTEGELYYRRQLRGRSRFYTATAGNPVTLAHDGIIDALEGDRDRRDLPALPLAEAVGMKLSPEDLHRVFLHLMPFWKLGNDVLAGLLSAAVARKLRYPWPARWLARSAKTPGLVEFAERQGFYIALAGFAEVGMRTPDDHYTSLETRPPTPLERGRFAVVRDLYGELVGQPARVTRFEVFGTEGAAVAGQHLGDKVILGAELFEKGFDGVSGTILHELAHETGGEEDIRFLRRLTVLLGAALRSPEKIRDARRRYTAAGPAPEPPPEGTTDTTPAYTPEHDRGGGDLNGVIVTVVLPPAFPPAEALMATIRAAAAETGVPIYISSVAVPGPIGAVTWRAPGLPTVFVGGVDVEPPPAALAEPGYRLRTYGPEGDRLCPDPESIRAALLRSKALGHTGKVGLSLHGDLCADHFARVKAALGIALPEPPPRKKQTRRAERDERVRQYFQGSFGQTRYGLDGVWQHGRYAAVEAWLERASADRRKADTVYFDIQRRLARAVAHAESLRGADGDFDDADELEREAMDAAMGAAVIAYAQEEGDAEANEARAEAAFRAVRAGTTRVLDLPVVQDAKVPLLEHAMAGAGLSRMTYPREGSFDVAAFGHALDRAEAEVLRLQRIVDEEGGNMLAHTVTTALDKLHGDTPATRMAATWEAQRQSSFVIRDAYLQVLAASGDAIAAARHAMDEVARLRPELSA
jgi:hypothetical protein